MAKASVSSRGSIDGAGAVAAAHEFIEDAITKFGKHHDTIRSHVVAVETELKETVAEAERQRAADEKTIAQMKEQYTRDTGELKTKNLALEEKIRKAFGNLS